MKLEKNRQIGVLVQNNEKIWLKNRYIYPTIMNNFIPCRVVDSQDLFGFQMASTLKSVQLKMELQILRHHVSI